MRKGKRLLVGDRTYIMGKTGDGQYFWLTRAYNLKTGRYNGDWVRFPLEYLAQQV